MVVVEDDFYDIAEIISNKQDRIMEQEQGEVKVVVFDLNGTFYNKSSKEEFYRFICTRRPKKLKYAFEMAYFYLRHKLHQISRTEFKENFFNYLDNLPPSKVNEYATEFWKEEFPKNFNKELINRFKEFKQQEVILFCATGGLELYVKPLFDLYEIDGFAGTKVNYNGETYIADGLACKEEEKISRLEKFLKGKAYRIIEAYSDSKEEILHEAEKAYLIENGKIKPFD